jgi:hypothetical protein
MRGSLALIVLVGCSTDIQVADKVGVAPAAVINAPADGSAFGSNELVELVGTVTDGDGLADLATVFWTSSIDGELGDVTTAAPDVDGITRLSVVLSPGQHGITLRVTDQAGHVAEDGIDVAVAEASQDPEVVITSPSDFEEHLPGDDVSLVGTVADAQQTPDTLTARWRILNNSDGSEVANYAATPSSAGLVTGTWSVAGAGNFRVDLDATDQDGHTTTAEVLVVVGDPDLADVDHDGYAVVAGDCDDHDPSVNPGAVEVCGNAKDDDCNSWVDDKDLDLDQHVDAACVNYVGVMPIDDCDDADPTTYPGAYELPDGIDNDCDGRVDNGGPGFDDDGDCFCETAPCTGTDAVCPTGLLGGDCDDADAATNPAAPDDPDPAYVDSNCDSIDGDLLGSVFLDPIGGGAAASGLDPLDPVLTLPQAYAVAAANGLDWVLIAQGSLAMTGSEPLVEGVNLAGGYDAAAGWTRSAVDVPDILLPSTGKKLTGWVAPTQWHQLAFLAADAVNTGGSSIALVLDASFGLSLVDCVVSAGNGKDGSNGSNGSLGGSGFTGSRGGDGCEDSSVFCSSCTNPVGGKGGGACGGGGAGGKGGNPGIGSGSGNTGSKGGGTGGGNGGSLGVANGGSGGAGSPGAAGAEGSAGLPGGPLGTFSAAGYTPANGTSGGVGAAGAGGGGGGGGAGGGWTFGNCDVWGGGGGGGGGGGCGGTGGTGGNGGGASIGILLVNGSTIAVTGGAIDTGNGGRGGNGGTAGNGGSGGGGGAGGAGSSSIINEVSGAGGIGGAGGAGGRGGHGGGGGGGPAIGVVCRGGSVLGDSGVSFGIGSGGAGGGGSGAPGSAGAAADTDGC